MYACVFTGVHVGSTWKCGGVSDSEGTYDSECVWVSLGGDVRGRHLRRIRMGERREVGVFVRRLMWGMSWGIWAFEGSMWHGIQEVVRATSNVCVHTHAHTHAQTCMGTQGGVERRHVWGGRRGREEKVKGGVGARGVLSSVGVCCHPECLP